MRVGANIVGPIGETRQDRRTCLTARSLEFHDRDLECLQTIVTGGYPLQPAGGLSDALGADAACGTL